MIPTVYQKPEIRDANDNIIQQGAFGKNTALANATNDGWIDYVANDLEFLYGLAKDEVVPVSALPASGDMNKTYLLTTTGVCYRWDGTAWVEISSSEAVGRAETAANLAEQWATKTNGTVADNEYSAKYYANSAQQSADDAQDVADDMADHLAQIDQNTGGVSANSKRIGNIEKLLQGNLYDYDTDDDTAYAKAVPAGAMPYAGLEKVGGKTVVMNQLFPELNATNFAYQKDIASISFADGVCSFTVSAQNGWCGKVSNNFALKSGHKYYASVDVKGYSGATIYVFMLAGSYNTQKSYTNAAWQRFNAVVTISSDFVPSTSFSCTDGTASGWQEVQYKNVTCIDLTLAFGSGNEPSTVAEAEAMFPASYYPYNAGTLLSAGATEVVSQSKNLAYYGDGLGQPSDTTPSNTTKRIFPIGKYIAGIDYLNNYNGNAVTVTEIDNGLIINKTTGTYYGCGIPFKCVGGAVYTAKVVFGTHTANSLIALSWYKKDGTYITRSASSADTITAPASADAVIGLFIVTDTSPCTITNIQIEKGSTVSAYTPAFIEHYPIPTAIRNLEGYGWSAGSVYNYVDFERKVFVKRVGSYTINGNTTFSKAKALDDGSGYWVSLDLFFQKNFPQNPAFVNVVMDKRYIQNPYTTYWEDLTFGEWRTYNRDFVITVPPQCSTKELATAYFANNPATLYYELATPVEVDISAYLTDDNLINVESGGTLTFPNQNGTDYQIPVPSEETYMIDLQEAINNG